MRIVEYYTINMAEKGDSSSGSEATTDHSRYGSLLSATLCTKSCVRINNFETVWAEVFDQLS